MSEVKCPECKVLVSNELTTCPTCGFPLKERKNKSTEMVSVTAENIDMALEQVRELLNADSLADIEYEVLQMNKNSIFGKKPAIIHARCKGVE
nr:Jag N-terminal domain-containing protein [Eubacterium sp.]